MTPEDIELQKEKDLAVIAALETNGANMSKPHLIEHHFITLSKDNGLELLKRGKENGFEVSELTEGQWQGERYNYFDLIKPTVPIIENIFPDTSQMLHLAVEFDCEYDGWGCELLK